MNGGDIGQGGNRGMAQCARLILIKHLRFLLDFLLRSAGKGNSVRV